MPLPILPSQGQNPWFTERNNWDQAVEVELEGRLSEAGIRASIAASTGLNVLDFGAKGDGVTNDTVAIQAAVNACAPGQAVIFPHTGSGRFYLITATIRITTPSIRFIGQPRDAYAVSIRTNVPGLVMFSVEEGGFVCQDMGFIGKATLSSAWTNGQGCDVTAFIAYGGINADVDAEFIRCTWQYMATTFVITGRNIKFLDCLWSNVIGAIYHDGIDPVKNPGPSAQSNRGIQVRDCRFHNIGYLPEHVGIYFTPNARLEHLILADNHFDSSSGGRHVHIEGNSTYPAKGVTIWNHKSTELPADAITLDYCQYPLIDGVHLIGSTGVQNGVVIRNSLYATLVNFSMRYMMRSAIVLRNNSGVTIGDGTIVQAGQDTGTNYDAIDVDSTNSDVRISNVVGRGGRGWFVAGSPTGDSSLIGCSYSGFTLGGINSNTLLNFSSRGVNSFVEGRRGRIEDTGYGQYDLAAATSRTLATVTAGTNFGSFIVEVELSGRDGVVGTAYFSGRRYVRPENGTPVITVIGTDSTSGATVTFSTSGTTGIVINVQTANATFIGAKVRAVAGGAATNTTSRSVTVTMASQP